MTIKMKTTTVKGNLFDERRRAIGGVKVMLDSLETTTLFDGSYSFHSVSAGSHKLEVAVEGYKNTTRTIEVKEEELANVDFRLEPEIGEGRVYGHVIERETGKPIGQGGTVYMSNSVRISSTPIEPVTGHYEFAGLPKGTYNIWASVLDYGDEKKTVRIEKDEKRREDFLIRRKEPEPPWG